MTNYRLTLYVKRSMREAAQDPTTLTHTQLLENCKVAHEKYTKANAVLQRFYEALIKAKFVLEADPNNQSKLKKHEEAIYDYDSANLEMKKAFAVMMTANARFVREQQIQRIASSCFFSD